jgi:hypothetical protein
METGLLNNNVAFDTTHEWFSEQFISDSLVKYLKENGYKIHKDLYNKMPDKVDTIITASKFFSKEIIEVKGFPTEFYKNSISKETPKNLGHLQHAKNWFSEALLNSFVNFGKYYSNDSADVAMALPNVHKYKAIIEKVQDYFSLNNLYFKIYLVNEDGSVEVSNLNTKYIKENS